MSSPYVTDIGTVHASLAEVQSNVSYMRREQAGIPISDAARNSLKKVLDEFDGLLYDLRTEARNLEDKLGMHPGEPPNDPDIRNPDPRVTLGFLREWPRETFQMLDVVVRALERLAAGDRATGSAYLLVAESAVNMLNAHKDVLEAVDRTEALLQENASRP